MLLTADEVVRSLRGSLRLLRREPDGLRAFDTSLQGFWHSFAAIVLTAPAFLVLLAQERHSAGLYVPGSYLFDDLGLVVREASALFALWVAFPLLMIGFVRLMGLERRYVGYIVTYNWSGVIAATVLALPMGLNVLGLATHALATFYALAFGIVLLQYRWFLARIALGVTGSLAALLVGLDIAVGIGVLSVVRSLAG